MKRKALLTMGLALLAGAGLGASLPGVPSTRAQSPASYLHLARWGHGGGEEGEVEAPRWGDATSEGTVEAPRGDDRSTSAGQA